MTSTYGTINYTERFWLIQGEPFVRARLKRVFPRVPQHAAKHICISVTPENTRELAWFIDRYPMDVDRRDIMDRLADQHRDCETRLADLMAGHVLLSRSSSPSQRASIRPSRRRCLN